MTVHDSIVMSYRDAGILLGGFGAVLILTYAWARAQTSDDPDLWRISALVLGLILGAAAGWLCHGWLMR